MGLRGEGAVHDQHPCADAFGTLVGGQWRRASSIGSPNHHLSLLSPMPIRNDGVFDCNTRFIALCFLTHPAVCEQAWKVAHEKMLQAVGLR